MSRNRIVKECKLIRVEPGDKLYIKLPDRMSKEHVQNASHCIHEFFRELDVMVLCGQEKIEFTTVRPLARVEGSQNGKA